MIETGDAVQAAVEFPEDKKGKGQLSIGVRGGDIVLRIVLFAPRRSARISMTREDADWLLLALTVYDCFSPGRRLQNGADLSTVVPESGRKPGISIRGSTVDARPPVPAGAAVTAWLAFGESDRIVEALKKTLEPDGSGPGVDDKLRQRRDDLLKRIFN